jgi:hypothetical protein
VAGQPDPKSRTLARGARRYRRKVASPKQWQAIVAAKGPTCRLSTPGVCERGVEYHHLVARIDGGDDVPDNIVALCSIHHGLVTNRVPPALYRLAESLTDGEYAYVVGKLGEGGMERLFGVGGS